MSQQIYFVAADSDAMELEGYSVKSVRPEDVTLRLDEMFKTEPGAWMTLCSEDGEPFEVLFDRYFTKTESTDEYGNSITDVTSYLIERAGIIVFVYGDADNEIIFCNSTSKFESIVSESMSESPIELHVALDLSQE